MKIKILSTFKPYWLFSHLIFKIFFCFEIFVESTCWSPKKDGYIRFQSIDGDSMTILFVCLFFLVSISFGINYNHVQEKNKIFSWSVDIFGEYVHQCNVHYYIISLFGFFFFFGLNFDSFSLINIIISCFSIIILIDCFRCWW